MNYFEKNLNTFLEDIKKGDMGTPFGGSVIIFSILSNIQLLYFVLNYTLKKSKNAIEKESIELHLDILKKKNTQLKNQFDQDIKIVENIVNSYKSNPENIILNLKEAALFCIAIFDSVNAQIGNIIEKVSLYAHKAILSDLTIVNEMHYAQLCSLNINISINLLLLKKKDPKSLKWVLDIEKIKHTQLNLAFKRKEKGLEIINSRLKSNFYSLINNCI